MKKQLILFIILVLIVFLINRYYRNTNNVNLKPIKKNNEPGLLADVNLNKLLPIYIFKNGVLKEKKNYYKIKKNNKNFFTLNTLPDHGKFEGKRKGDKFENSSLTIFEDKPGREKYEVSLEHGLKLFIPNNSKYNIITETPNVVLNLVIDGKIISFIVAVTHVKTPFSNNEVAYFRGHIDNHYLHDVYPAEKNKLNKFRDKMLKNGNLEDKYRNDDKELRKIYGEKYLDIILRSCNFTFVFLNPKEEKEFEEIMQNKFNSISQISLTIDKGSILTPIVKPIVHEIIKHPKIIIDGMTFPSKVGKSIWKNITNSCKCADAVKGGVCTAFSKALSLAIAVAIGPEGEAADIAEEAGRDSFGTVTVEAIHKAIVDVVNEHSSDNESRKSAEEIADTVLEVGVCAAEFVSCITTKVCQIMFDCE